MSTITDLRDTLERHAAEVVDTGPVDRVGAVRQQVRVARQRRAAAAVTAAVVALGGTVAAIGLADEPGATPQPAAELAGHPVPAELTSLGYTYTYSEGTAGAAQAMVRLPASDRPRLVSWAASEDGVKLVGPGKEVWTSSATDFDDFTFVPPGDRATFSAYGDDVALAVYDLTGGAPEGVTRDGITFRQQVAGQPLLGATIGDPGAARVSADIGTAGAGRVTIAYFCAGGSEDLWVHVSLGEGSAGTLQGCTDTTFDPGLLGSAIGHDVPPGGGAARVWVTEGQDGPLVDDPDLRLGAAAYGAPDSSVVAAGQPVPSLVEADGHTWQLVDLEDAGNRERSLTVRAPGEDVYATAFLTGTPLTTYGDVVRNHRVVYRFSGGDDVVAGLGVVRADSSPLVVRLRGPVPPDSRMAVATYSKLG